ncbi:hypothetical protein PI124_g22730 [Phytophthora idaei]|nr:hypothetical protein PI125_g24594 [Phytophthora idaei]KAG3125911.1 hypothetical protein PI126_g22561 [Phytophthora idaei]KAG3232182.1 hypothetical protein PI124_g22730 [Phytophthora idaei]
MKEDLTSSTTAEDRQAIQRYKERICKELLRSRLQQIERLEANLERMAKYSIKLLDAHEEIAKVLAHDPSGRCCWGIGARRWLRHVLCCGTRTVLQHTAGAAFVREGVTCD